MLPTNFGGGPVTTGTSEGGGGMAAGLSVVGCSVSVEGCRGMSPTVSVLGWTCAAGAESGAIGSELSGSSEPGVAVAAGAPNAGTSPEAPGAVEESDAAPQPAATTLRNHF